MNNEPPQVKRLQAVFGKSERFEQKDLQVLRSDIGHIGYLSSRADGVELRMQVELIDTIRQLDETSTKLIQTTNRLTRWILLLTVIGVSVAAAGLLVAFATYFKGS